MEEIIYHEGDLVRVKKPHPCGAREWEILRLGADVRLKCAGCGRIVLVPREKFRKMARSKVEPYTK